jgi:hypothetical protein
MSRIHEDSPTAVLPQFSLWELPGTQEMVTEDRIHVIRPVSTFSANTPIRFDVRPPLDEYTLLNESDLYCKLKVTVSHAKQNLTGNMKEHFQKVKPVKNLLHSMFKFVQLSINGRQINLSPSIYSYKSYLETYLGYTDVAKAGYLDSIPWNDPDILVRGMETETSKSSVIDLEGQLSLDLGYQEKAILGGCPFTIELIPHQPTFYLKCEKDYQVEVEIMDIYFRCQRLQVVQGVVDGHNEGLKNKMARYSFSRNEIIHRTIPAKVNDFTLDHVFNGVLPRRVFVCFVTNDQFNGIGKENPFAFKQCGVSFLASYLNGKQVPSIPFTPDFDNHLVVREFRSIYKGLNQTGTDTFYAKSRKQWEEEPIFCINYACDLSNGGSFSSHVNTRKIGSLSFHVKFKKENDDPIVALFFSETDSCLEIDLLRNAYPDY